MTTEHSPPDYCAHGEPRGFRYCALCRNSGATLKEEGQARALAAAPSTWRGRAEKTLTELASNGTTFTADDLIALAGLPRDSETNANNAVGALLSGWARSGRIRKVGYASASRAVSHGRVLAVWEGA